MNKTKDERTRTSERQFYGFANRSGVLKVDAGDEAGWGDLETSKPPLDGFKFLNLGLVVKLVKVLRIVIILIQICSNPIAKNATFRLAIASNGLQIWARSKGH